MLTQRESVDTSQGLDVPTAAAAKGTSDPGTPGPPQWVLLDFPLVGAEMGRAAGPPSGWTLCWAIRTQLSFRADSLGGGSPITWFCLHSVAPSCQPKGDCGKTEG